MRTRFLLTLILIALIGGTACNRSSKPAKQSIFMKRELVLLMKYWW